MKPFIISSNYKPKQELWFYEHWREWQWFPNVFTLRFSKTDVRGDFISGSPFEKEFSFTK